MDYKKYAIVDLHLHLDGSLSAKAILDVAKKEQIELPTNNEDELNRYLMVPENCGSLNEYLERFALPNLVLQSKYGLETCTLDLLKRLADDGLKYVEIRMAPQLSINKGLTQEEKNELEPQEKVGKVNCDFGDNDLYSVDNDEIKKYNFSEELENAKNTPRRVNQKRYNKYNKVDNKNNNRQEKSWFKKLFGLK